MSSENAARRHLTASQLAYSVAGMKDYEERKAKERQGRRNDLTSVPHGTNVSEDGRTAEKLASIAGVGKKTMRRPSRLANRDPRWPALRLQALRRDGWKCTECGSKYRLEVHHVQSVRTHPELAFTLANLAVLCAPCHVRETRRELGQPPPDPERQRWAKLLRHSTGSCIK